ncbi:hypothetical protein [Lentimicrobium sp.]|jgi:hypothetical protein|uniref:hypothetical protein n=1 Tax=Lentimicrobium sp. TaxID=2034841 RepID=UPI0025D4CB91|nr:hypothetical protein [Lentimicrobium sp.]MCO5257462.1 hypothetical protein [Lentimicrobium sp.]MCO5262581.1 hypothetical protein [Lentimicrobium sp.]HOP13831.1 hypothetical protein [Lentimicrobium sp.]HPF65175.1 hypothetical protein [Lentimicrobium sp.]HPJ62681.1 hypothetical protein [Lentimicrobium sp.]
MNTKLKINIESQYFISDKMKGHWCRRVKEALQYQVVRSKTEQAVNRDYRCKNRWFRPAGHPQDQSGRIKRLHGFILTSAQVKKE